MNSLFRKNDRKERIEELEQRLADMLKVDFPAAYTSENQSAALLRIRGEERLISSILSALRMQQSEDRMANNLLIPILGGISLVVVALVGYLIKLNI